MSGETLREKIAKLLGTDGDLDVSKFKPSGGALIHWDYFGKQAPPDSPTWVGQNADGSVESASFLDGMCLWEVDKQGLDGTKPLREQLKDAREHKLSGKPWVRSPKPPKSVEAIVEGGSDADADLEALPWFPGTVHRVGTMVATSPSRPKDIDVNIRPLSASEAAEVAAKLREGLEKSLKEAWERQAKEGK